jgi:hypothetical protein
VARPPATLPAEEARTGWTRQKGRGIDIVRFIRIVVAAVRTRVEKDAHRWAPVGRPVNDVAAGAPGSSDRAARRRREAAVPDRADAPEVVAQRRCATCGRALGGDPDDQPTGDAGAPICGECDRQRNFDVLDLADGRFDDRIG